MGNDWVYYLPSKDSHCGCFCVQASLHASPQCLQCFLPTKTTHFLSGFGSYHQFSKVFPSHFVSPALRALRALNQARRSGLASSREALLGQGLSKTTLSFLAWGYSVFRLHISLVLSIYSFTYKLQLRHNLLPGLCSGKRKKFFRHRGGTCCFLSLVKNSQFCSVSIVLLT